nr:LysR substrate-binding domain-containing protein [Brevundimonas sp. P7753]
MILRTIQLPSDGLRRSETRHEESRRPRRKRDIPRANDVSAKVFTDDYACLVDRSTLPSDSRMMDLKTYLARPHALVAVHGEASTEIDEAFHAAGHARRVALVIPHWSVAPKLIAGTDLVLTVARNSLKSVSRDRRLAVLPPPIPLPSIGFSQISHRRRQSDPALRWLREMIVRSGPQVG